MCPLTSSKACAGASHCWSTGADGTTLIWRLWLTTEVAFSEKEGFCEVLKEQQIAKMWWNYSYHYFHLWRCSVSFQEPDHRRCLFVYQGTNICSQHVCSDFHRRYFLVLFLLISEQVQLVMAGGHRGHYGSCLYFPACVPFKARALLSKYEFMEEWIETPKLSLIYSSELNKCAK